MTAQEWLDSELRDYEAGRLIYEAHGDNLRLKRALAHGPSSYNRESLAWELGKLARAGVTADVATPAPAGQDGQTGQEGPDVGQTDTPASEPAPAPVTALLHELKEERRPLHDERTVLHQSLEGLPSDADRLDAAGRILELSRTLDASYATSAHVQAHGELPAGPAPAPGLDSLSPAELLKKRNNLRSQRTKLKKRPDRADDLAAVEATLAQVEALLNPPA